MEPEVGDMASPTKFAHVVYRTRRFDEMIDWYERVFEATVRYRDPVLAFLTYDEEHHRFAFVNLAALKPTSVELSARPEVGVDHVAYTYASLGDLLETYSRLKQRGILPYWPVHHGPTVSFYYKDPDGNRIEFQIDCFRTADEATAYMQGEAFAANPIGVAIDPEALLKQYRSGTPIEALLARPDGPLAPIPAEHGV
jgi:catechol 2,3-dioxygenase-like lactoylglutathione lyase family enzyme